MTRSRSTIVTLLLAFLSLGFFVRAASASEAGRRNTTIGLGAATAYFAAKKQWVPAAIAGVGTVVAHHNWQAKIDARHRHEHRLALRHAYRVGFRRGHYIASRRAHYLAMHRRRHRRAY